MGLESLETGLLNPRSMPKFGNNWVLLGGFSWRVIEPFLLSQQTPDRLCTEPLRTKFGEVERGRGGTS
jgi:hypothetical protein